MQSLFQDKETFVEFADSLKKKNKVLWNKFKQAIRKFLDKLDTALKGFAGEKAEGFAGEAVQNALTDINEKVKLFQSDIDILDEALSSDGLDEGMKAALKSQRQSKIYQQQFQKALKSQVGGILDKMHGDNYSTISEYLNGCYEQGFVGTMYDMAKQGVPLIIPIDQAAAVKAVLTDSKVSKGLYNALGVNVGNLKKAITREISRGIASALPYRDIARNLSSVTKAPFSRTKTITRTEGHRIQQTSAADAQFAAKKKGADVVKQWDASLDARTRDSHASIDGEIREIDDKFSNGLRFPGDPNGPAAEVINCRCTANTRARWALDEDELRTLKEHASFFGLDKTKNFKEFNEKYLKAVDKVEKSDIILPRQNAYGFETIKDHHGIIDDIVSNGIPTCNPNFSTGQWGYTQNCQRCVQAYEFRRRGYNVVATERPVKNNKIIWGCECFTDADGNPAKFVFRQTSSTIKKVLNSAPDGSRYTIYVRWKGRSNGAHVFVAEKENGVVRYIDPQTGRMDASGYFSQGSEGHFGYFRMDDKQLTTDKTVINATMEKKK